MQSLMTCRLMDSCSKTEVTLDQILAYLGAEYVQRKEVEEQNSALQAQVAELQATIARMLEKQVG